MLYIDAKYVNLLSYKLRNFKKKKENYWNFSCPLCGDSKSNALKARGYVFTHKARLVYKCHNCGYSSNVGNLIKHLDSTLYNEYVLERYKENTSKHNDHTNIDETDFFKTPKVEVNSDLVAAGAINLEDLPIIHPAVKYAAKRKIPRDKWKLLYFVPKFKEFVNKVKFQFPNTDRDIPRLIIPFFKNKECIALQGRAFGKEIPKYITIKLDEDEEKIFGLDRVNYNETIYIVEGPLDSLFIPNCIAASGAGMDTGVIKSIKDKAVLVMDNEPRSKEICNYIEKYINNGYNVCMWPETMKYKDINDMVLAGLSEKHIIETINTNTFNGIEAKLKYSEWRKC